MSPWPLDTNAALIAFYGNPFSRMFSMNLIPFFPNWQMVYKDDNGKVSQIRHFVVHKKCHESLSRIFSSIWSAYGQDQSKIEGVNLHWYGGCYAPRNVRGSSSKISCHGFAAALDIDPDHNAMNYNHQSKMPKVVIDAFKAEGWSWGGDYHSRQDPMHFGAAHE